MKYKPLTHAQARRAWEWFALMFRLSDWTLTLSLDEEPPAWATAADDSGVLAQCIPSLRFQRANVWVSNGRCAANGVDPVASLMHEFFHIAEDNTGVRCREYARWESLVDRLGPCLAAAYRGRVKL